jgi:hypothetical protein
MPIYLVPVEGFATKTVEVSVESHLRVEASNPEEAVERAEQMIEDTDDLDTFTREHCEDSRRSFDPDITITTLSVSDDRVPSEEKLTVQRAAGSVFNEPLRKDPLTGEVK